MSALSDSLAELKKRFDMVDEEQKKELISLIAKKLEDKKMEAIKKSKPTMTMTWELITPEYARILLKTNSNNRHLSKGTVTAYANDMKAGKWDSNTADAIAIDSNGTLRNGQHRLAAIAESGCSIWMWVCRGVAPDGIYDSNRKRTLVDQTKIIRSDLGAVYSNLRTQALVKSLILKIGKGRRTVSPAEYFDYVDKHKNQLDEFLSKISLNKHGSKVIILPVYYGLYLAYLNGEKLDDIASFYDILASGMSDSPIGYPVIAYRNYLLNTDLRVEQNPTVATVSRCQFAFKKYLSCSCLKRSKSLDKLIWEEPEEEATLF